MGPKGRVLKNVKNITSVSTSSLQYSSPIVAKSYVIAGGGHNLMLTELRRSGGNFLRNIFKIRGWICAVVKIWIKNFDEK